MAKQDAEKKKKTPHGGIRGLAEMFQVMPEKERAQLLTSVAKRDPGLVEKIAQQMFLFQDLGRLSDRTLQTLLREIPQKKWVLALRNASEDLVQKLTRSLSQRAAKIFLEDVQTQGPQRLSDVTAAQEEVLRLARELEKQGKVALKVIGSDDVIE